jgi:hypothetical protein
MKSAHSLYSATRKELAPRLIALRVARHIKAGIGAQVCCRVARVQRWLQRRRPVQLLQPSIGIEGLAPLLSRFRQPVLLSQLHVVNTHVQLHARHLEEEHPSEQDADDARDDDDLGGAFRRGSDATIDARHLELLRGRHVATTVSAPRSAR